MENEIGRTIENELAHQLWIRVNWTFIYTQAGNDKQQKWNDWLADLRFGMQQANKGTKLAKKA